MYNPAPVAPRYGDAASCSSTGGAVDTMFTVLNRKTGVHMDIDSEVEVDTTIGSIVKSTWDSGAQSWTKVEETHFTEILYIGGIVAAADCSTLAFIATRPPTDCGHAYTDVTSALSPCENADRDLVANFKGAWTGSAQQLLDLGWASPTGYCFEDNWLNNDIHGPSGSQRRWPVGVTVPSINHLWLYEWTGSAAQVGGVPSMSGAPSGKYIVSKMGPLDNWGKMELAYGYNDGTHGTYAFSGTTTCCCGSHVADSFIVVARGATHADWAIVESRSNLWATGTGHTVNNRMAYNPVSKRYLWWVTTDNFDTNVNGGCNNTEGQEFGATWYGSLGHPLSGQGARYGEPWSNNDKGCRGYGAGYVMIDGDTRDQKDRYVYGFNLARQYMTKGTLATLMPLSDGGFLGVLNGEPNNYPKGSTKIDTVEWYPKDPPTSIGIMRFNAAGVVVEADGTACTIDPGLYGGADYYSATGLGYGTSKGNACVKWIRCDPRHYLSYPTLAPLGNDRFLLGWTQMIPTEYLLTDFTGNAPRGENDRNWNPDQEWPWAFYMRVPKAFWVAEISASGELQTDPQELSGIGWGEYNNMASMGTGRVAWTYIPNPTVDHVRPSPASEVTTAADQTARSPPCRYRTDRHDVKTTTNPSTYQTTVYTQSTAPSSRPSQCEGPADGQPVCSRLSPPLRNSTYGCGGIGGWEAATGLCSQETLQRLGRSQDDGYRGRCGNQPPSSGTSSGSERAGLALHIRIAICSMIVRPMAALWM